MNQQPPSDPFETTLEDSSSPAQSRDLSAQYSSRGSTVIAVVAIIAIGAAWFTGRIPVAWHAIVAILVAALPAGVQVDLLKFVARRVPFLGGKK